MSVSKKLIDFVQNNPLNKELFDSCTFFNIRVKLRRVEILCVYKGVIIRYFIIIDNYSFKLKLYDKKRNTYYAHIRGDALNYYSLENNKYVDRNEEYEELFIQNYKYEYTFRFSDLQNDELVKLSEIISKYINIFKNYLDEKIEKVSSNEEIIRLLRDINKNIFQL